MCSTCSLARVDRARFQLSRKEIDIFKNTGLAISQWLVTRVQPLLCVGPQCASFVHGPTMYMYQYTACNNKSDDLVTIQ